MYKRRPSGYHTMMVADVAAVGGASGNGEAKSEPEQEPLLTEGGGGGMFSVGPPKSTALQPGSETQTGDDADSTALEAVTPGTERKIQHSVSFVSFTNPVAPHAKRWGHTGSIMPLPRSTNVAGVSGDRLVSCFRGNENDAVAGNLTDGEEEQIVLLPLLANGALHVDRNNPPVEVEGQERDLKYYLSFIELTYAYMYASPPSHRIKELLSQRNFDDHETHAVFCELEELRDQDGDFEWRETNRWVKFEETVEEGGNRWSKPHVATLSLHSLFELRKGLLCGTVMLDVQANDFDQVIELLVDELVSNGQLSEEDKDDVWDILCARHRHQHQKKIKEKDCRAGEMTRRGSMRSMNSKEGMPGGRVPSNAGLEGLNRSASTHKFNENFMRKIPPGAEAANILVGEMKQLENPVIAFIRLKKSNVLGNISEVAIPSRFMFVLLGPHGHKQRYHEIGRSIATLMSDEVFHDIAYKARNRGDLLAGIDEFLDQVTVLPPGEWDPSIRIEPPKSVPSQAERKKLPPLPADPDDEGGDPDKHALADEEEEVVGHCDPTLERTGRIFGGLVQDIKRKVPWYLSDFTDGIHIQCLASFGFIYFACLTPIITFGGLLGAATQNNMGAMESLITGAIAGTTWHMFSGQPLTIIGSTGPVLVFETIMFNFCQMMGWNYLSLRLWVGLWMALILLIMVAFDISALVRYITRFTEESFALLIALIFIVEAFKKLFHILDDQPVDLHPEVEKDYSCFCLPPIETLGDLNVTGVTEAEIVRRSADSAYDETTSAYMDDYSYLGNATETEPDWANMGAMECTDLGGSPVGSGCLTTHYVPDVFFFSCLLFIFTFFISITLKNLRNGRFFPNKVRSIISDFAVMISICSMVGLDFFVGLDTPKLLVPEKVQPTRSDRGWIINPFMNPVWTIPAAIGPAMLATILIFMDQQITAVIVNRKEHLLRKGGGYHLDLLLIALQIAACSILGTPWFVAATVLSINHVRSLGRESETSAPGESAKFLGVREQRLTGTLVFILVGLSALMSRVLKFIPMPVLYGVFLFMGVSSLKGIQMCQRVVIMFMPQKYQPDYVYLRHVPLWRCHIFTVIQIACLTALWLIKSIKSISIVFPLMVLAMCFVRKLLDYVFSRHELRWLDDVLPESAKKEKEDKKKKKDKTIKGEMVEIVGGQVTITLADGRQVSIPVDRLLYDAQNKKVNGSADFNAGAPLHPKEIEANRNGI